MVVLMGFPPDEVAQLREMFIVSNVTFVAMPDAATRAFRNRHFEQSHVPFSALARLFTPDLIPESYEHVVYLDGDVQLVGDVEPLLSATVPCGRILAATDQYIISAAQYGYSGELWRRARQYLASINIVDPAEYFNSGVLAARRSTWSSLCQEARDYFYYNSAKCTYHDQTALNAVCLGRREILSPRYNYITPFAAANGFRLGEQSIVHFTGSDKPWLFTRRAPWKATFKTPYDDILRLYPQTSRYVRHWAALREQLGGDAPPRRTHIGAASNTWSNFGRRKRLTSYLAETTFAVK